MTIFNFTDYLKLFNYTNPIPGLKYEKSVGNCIAITKMLCEKGIHIEMHTTGKLLTTVCML